MPLRPKHLILARALRKAVKGGFYSFANGAAGDADFGVLPENHFGQIKVFIKDWPDEYWSAEAILFNQDFARALWPWRDDSKCPYCGIAFPGTLSHPRPCPLADSFFPYLWQYHQHQMLLAGDQVFSYLDEHI